MRTSSLAALVAAAAIAFAGSAVAQQPRTLKIQSAVPPTSTTQDSLRFFADRVGKLTGGQLKIETHPRRARSSRPSRCSMPRTRRSSMAPIAFPTTGPARARRRRCSPTRRPGSPAWTCSTTWAGSMRAAASTCGGSSTRRSSSSISSPSRCTPPSPQALGWFSGPSPTSPTSKA